MALQICAFVKTLEKVRRRHVCLSYLGRLPWNRHFRMSCQMVSRIPCKVLTGCRMSSSTSPPILCRNRPPPSRIFFFFFSFLSSPILHDKLSKRVRNENKRPGFWPLACGRHFFFPPPFSLYSVIPSSSLAFSVALSSQWQQTKIAPQ